MGLANTGTISTLTNNGAIAGGKAFTFAVASSKAAKGGEALYNGGTIATLTNSGTIRARQGTVESGAVTGFPKCGGEHRLRHDRRRIDIVSA